MAASLSTLPTPLIAKIFDFAGAPTLFATECICREWRDDRDLRAARDEAKAAIACRFPRWLREVFQKNHMPIERLPLLKTNHESTHLHLGNMNRAAMRFQTSTGYMGVIIRIRASAAVARAFETWFTPCDLITGNEPALHSCHRILRNWNQTYENVLIIFTRHQRCLFQWENDNKIIERLYSKKHGTPRWLLDTPPGPHRLTEEEMDFQMLHDVLGGSDSDFSLAAQEVEPEDDVSCPPQAICLIEMPLRAIACLVRQCVQICGLYNEMCCDEI